MTVSKNEVDALLNCFPGPLTIGLSIPKYLLVLAGAGVLVAMGIWFIQSAETLAAVLGARHGAVRGEGFLRLLILLRVARDMSQAVAELGWVTLIFGIAGTLLVTAKLMCGVTGLWGLTLDREGFIVRTFKHNNRHGWEDVGDFDTLELRWSIRRILGLPLSKSCVVFNDYQAPESPIKWLRLTGRNRALIESYEYSAETLALAMSLWRERALGDRASQDS
jgi:hypothetical protein